MNTDTLHPTTDFLRSIDIHELLPQQEPFVMIDKLIGFDETKTETETVIKSNNIFIDDDEFSESGLIENIAQTCAARIGYVNNYILKKGTQLGYIGAIRNLEIKRLPKVGDKITTSMTVVEAVFGMTLANATIYCNDNIIVSTEMKIAVKEG